MEERDWTSRERKALRYFAGLDSSVSQFEKDLRTRLRMVPDGWRSYRLARSMFSKVLIGLYETLPNKTRVNLALSLAREEIIIRPKTVVKSDEMVIIPESVLATLVNLSTASECSICLKTGAEVKQCGLRKGLMLILPPPDKKISERCPYLNIVASN